MTRGKRPDLLDFAQERIRLLHFTWIAFFITFYVWFNMAPLATTILREEGGPDGWLTPEHMKLLAICNVALTIPARIIVGALIDKFGPRRCFSGLLILGALPAFAFAFGTTFVQLAVSRLLLSSIGAGFVVGIRLVAQWFPPKMIGRAEGFYAGWGNFGSAWAAMTLPWVALEICGGGPNGWRYALAINGLVSVGYGIAFLFLVKDMPEGRKFAGVGRTQPMLVESRADLVRYLAWSFPLVAALGFLAWRASNVPLGPSGESVLSSTALWTIYGVLAAVFVVHAIKSVQVNLPHIRAGAAEDMRVHFPSVAALNTTYFANFGAELAVVSMLPAFFESTFAISPTQAGLVASSFAFVNLFARPMGGLLSDKLSSRKGTMIAYMLGITAGFAGMACITGSWPLWAAVLLTIVCSLFVQGAEGATFAVIPMINKRMTGQIAGMAGAYGNVGAVVYLVLFTMVTPSRFFMLLAVGAGISVVACLAWLREPEGSFADAHELESTDAPRVAGGAS